ncbi:Fibropellin-1 [Stylophora pistillata]|uniref:Fibropellin-1 n=1 Tax=Stylophora pistillata TaxID=50429 RepID=A0A2B4S2L2_STYPI|nr:Fibropellin-1 [Stylophora pistillata]
MLELALNRDSSDSEGLLLIMMVEETFRHLNITGIISARVEDGDECGFACAANPKCFSYNLEANISVTGTGLCELLPSDKYNNSDKFIKSRRFHHYSIKSRCSSGPCQNRGTCVTQYDNNSYVCVCAIGFTGKDCQINIDDCKNDPCQNNGTCIDRVNGFDCRCPPGFSGSRCELEIGISIMSTILSDNTDFLRNLSHFLTPAVGKTSRWLLCHRASTHGWAASTFHTRCDNKDHTVTIIKNGQYVFGGYTDIPWDSSPHGSYGTTTNAFIFSLRNKEELRPFKSMVLQKKYAIFRALGYGPTFGDGHDIHISDNANRNDRSYTKFANASNGYYETPKGVKDPSTVLAGTQNFSPDDWEVFYLG